MSPSVYPHPVAVSAFMICRGLCACTEIWMCVLYVSFWSKVRPRTFGCVAMSSGLLFIVKSRLLVYSAGSGVNRVLVCVVVLCWIDHVWSSECVCCACDPNERLSAPSICFVCVFECRKLSPHLGV